MPYIGNNLATQFQAFATQTITGDGSTGYTLDKAVANGKELLVYINNVKQEEGSGKSYTATGTTITFSAAVASTDSCYLVYLGSAIQTVTAPDGSVGSSQISSADLVLPKTVTIGSAGAEDTKLVFDGNAVDYHIGLDDSADKLTIGKGTALGTTTSLTIDENGIITKPLQPSFSVKPNAQQNNVAADNSQTVIQFNNEQFDTNADFDTSNYRFTAPVDGIYQFNLTLRMDNLDASANYYSIFFAFPTSRFAPFLFDPNLASNSDANIPYFPAVLALTIDLDANDTIDARIQQSNGTAETDIIIDSFFSGFLVG